MATMSITSRRSLPPFAAAALCGALALSACGSGSTAEADTDDGLATLETSNSNDADADATAGAVAAADGVASADEAALALSECLRGEGLDVPDIGVDADGNIDLRGAFQELGPGDDSFREAMDVCGDVLEGIEFGGGRGGGGGIADNTEIQDALLEFSACIRTEGFEDIADLTLGGQGGQPGAAAGDEATTDADGEAPGPGRGQREGGFGDPNARFAEQLGLDPEDPDVIAALDVCSPIIDQAFSDAGVGDRGAGA